MNHVGGSRMKVLAKILLSILSACVIVFAVIIGFNLYQVNHSSVKSAEELATKEGEKQAKNVENDLNYSIDMAKGLAITLNTMVDQHNANRQLTNKILKKTLEENSDFLGVWTIWEPNAFDGKDKNYKNKLGHDQTGRFIPYWNRSGEKISVLPLKDYDKPGAGDYYLLAKNSGKQVIMNPYNYEINGKKVLMTSFVIPIKKEGQVIGAVGVDMSLKSIQKVNDSIHLYKSGSGAIISNDGTIVAHPSEQLVGKSSDKLAGSESAKVKKAVQSGRTVSFTNVSSKKDVYNVYSPISIGSTNTPWSLLVTVPLNEVKEGSNTLLKSSLLIGIIGLIILVLLITLIARGLVKPIKKVFEKVQEIADGNLATEPLTIRSKDEIGQLAMAMNEMTENTRTLVKDAADISEQVNSYSEELSTFTNEMSEGIEQVSATSEQLAAGSTGQAQYASDILEKVQHVNGEMKEITQHIEEMENDSQKTEDSVQKGLQSATRSINGMQTIEEKVSSTATIVQQLGENSKEIREILDVINNIAVQTNLLALNAAIEAARAGEHGKGFSIVAEEVRKLAEQSAESTSKISSIIDGVLKETKEVEQAMDGVVQQVQVGSDLIKQNKETFDEINQNIQEMIVQINQVNSASQIIKQATIEVLSDVENIASISQESSAGTEELSATMEEQNASMQEINGMVNNLSKMAESLHLELSKFSY